MSQTLQTSLVFVVMVVGFFAAYRFARMSTMLCMLVGALAGAVFAGHGIALRHIVEGAFTFFDIVAIIIAATVFIRIQKESGGLNILVRDLIRGFYWSPPLLLVLLMFVLMLPGALTGSGTAAIMALGGLVGTVLERMRIPKPNVVAFVSLGGVLGLVAPPVNIPAMIISSGINMPYVGFFGPLFTLTVPLGAICALVLGVRHAGRRLDPAHLLAELSAGQVRLGRAGAYLPLIVLIGMMILQRTFPMSFPRVGIALMFVAGTVIALAVARGVSFLSVCRQSIRDTLPVTGLLIAVGSLVQVMTLTGVRGLFVITAITAPLALLFAALAIGLPLSGSILGTYGAASVFGVPFMLALLGRDPILATAGISLISALATLTPPTAIDGRAAVLVTKYDGSYGAVLMRSAAPWVLINIAGLLTVVYANQLEWMLW